MSKVILDDALRSRLNGLNAEVELCDESGRTVGRFVPEDSYKQLLYAWAKTQFTDDELARARQEIAADGGVSTAAVLAHLQSLRRAEQG